jgi:BASS family bile acid:Na+ symporter
MIAIILMTGSAPLMSTPSLTLLMGLDDTIAMLVMIAGTALAPFTLPFIALHLLGLDLGIDPVTWSLRLSLFVGSAVGAALILQKILQPVRIARAKEALDLAIVFLLVLFAIAIMDGVADRLMAETSFVIGVTGIAFGAYLLLLGLSSLVGRAFGARSGASIGFICANRNVGIILAVLPAGSHPDIFLFFAIWQMPMYIMPSLLAPFYRWAFKPAPQ